MPIFAVQCLSSSDQVILANIFNAYENSCIVARNTHFPTFPVIQHTSIHGFLNEIELLFPAFIDYFKHIPEFDQIVMDDKVRLVKNHFGIMLNINEQMMHPVTSSNLIITWTNIYGVDTAARLWKRNKILEQFLFDPILLKVVLIVLVLSSSNARMLESTDIDQICDDPLSIYFSQNIYVELLWRYILSRAVTQEDAVKFFDKLMLCILHMNNLHMFVYSYISHFKEEVKQMKPIMRNMWLKMDDEEIITDIDIAHNVTV
jgi:hypothetical protein